MKQKIVFPDYNNCILNLVTSILKKYNVIMVYNNKEDKILFCKREKEPYKGMYNLVGGKLEDGEDNIVAAYRELQEETGITKNDIILTHIMDIEYKILNKELQIFVGKLNKDVKLIEEVNKLYWIDKNDNFFDINKYAGEGNIGCIKAQVDIYKEIIIK